jgi:hypothetical protein
MIVRLLRGFAKIWFTLTASFIGVNLLIIWWQEGFWRVQEIMSAFNVVNFVIVVITLSPGIGAHMLSDYLERHRPHRSDPVGAVTCGSGE